MTEMNTEKKHNLWFVTSLDELVANAVNLKLDKSQTIDGIKVYTCETGEVVICATISDVPVAEAVPEPEPEPEPEPPTIETPDVIDQNLMAVLEKMLSYEEGCVLTEYKDTKGFPTIGIGHKIIESDRNTFGEVNGRLTITLEQAQTLLKQDVLTAFKGARSWLGAYWDLLCTNRKAVCVGMAYQMGVNALADFGPTREHIIRGQWMDVKDHFLNTKWYEDTARRVERMAYIMVTGKLPAEYNK